MIPSQFALENLSPEDPTLLGFQYQNRGALPPRPTALQELKTDALGNVAPYQPTPRDLLLDNYLRTRRVSASSPSDAQRQRAAHLEGGTADYEALLSAIDPRLKEQIRRKNTELVYDKDKQAWTVARVDAPALSRDMLFDPTSRAGQAFASMMSADPERASDLYFALTGDTMGNVRHQFAEMQGRTEAAERKWREWAVRQHQSGARVHIDPETGQRRWQVARYPADMTGIGRDFTPKLDFATDVEQAMLERFSPEIYEQAGLTDNYGAGRIATPQTKRDRATSKVEQGALERLRSVYPNFDNTRALIEEHLASKGMRNPSPAELERIITEMHWSKDPAHVRIMDELMAGPFSPRRWLPSWIKDAVVNANEAIDKTVSPEIENPVMRQLLGRLSWGLNDRASRALVPSLSAEDADLDLALEAAKLAAGYQDGIPEINLK